ncbi:MAG: sigma 54-interacting transcriptional regulator [candidate division Zixibacteria bacterium]|nr:sigma 54-interacting transcriptional regulator [candidate division Zixibacteria bacterium]MCI0596400.1 sigma 54-interacting transcriptional regulator [candidate division Zixibacteria bacterium]
MKLAETQESWRVFAEARQLLETGKVAEARAILLAQKEPGLSFSPSEEEAEAALLWAWILHRENAYTEAIAKARQAYGGYRLTSNHTGAAEALYLLGLLFALTGELRESEKSLLDALANYRRAADQKGIAQTYSELARLAFIRSDLKAAEEHLLESLEAARVAADSAGEGRAWGNLGRVQFLAGRWEEAEKSLQLALLVNRVINARASQARNHLSLAYLYAHQGRQGEMEREFSLAWELIRTEGLRREEAIYHEYRGEAFFWQKDWGKAEGEYREALAIARNLAPHSGLVTQVQRRWAELFLAQGQPAEAARRADEALKLAQVLSEKEEILACLRVLAEAWMESAQLEKARAALEQAFSFLPSVSLPTEEVRLKLAAAWLLPALESDRAQQHLEEAAAVLAPMKSAPVFTAPLFRTAEKLLEGGRILLLEKLLEVLERSESVLRLSEEERARRYSLASRLAERKVSFAYSPENRYALFLNLSRAESLEAKLLLLVREMRGQAAALYGLADGRKELAAAVGEWPDSVLGPNGDETTGPRLVIHSNETSFCSLSLPLLVEGERSGVLYLCKQGRPFSQEELNLAAAAASHFALELSHLTKKNLARENERLLATLEEKCAFPNIITRSPLLLATIEAAARVKDSDLSILLLGETGVGKDLLAKTIHFQSNRKEHRFVSVNCAALPETLLESELFGHRRGAFTGADRDKPGLFEEADGGTFFLDEVSEIPLSVQTKLLRVLEEKEVVRLGETRPRKVNVRLISAGNKDLKGLTETGHFRQDLFYRLSAFTLKLPSLRERKEDIPLLLEHFAEKYAGGKKLRFNPAAFELLCAHEWPGNVRELENEVRKLAVLADEGGLVSPELLSAKFFGPDEKFDACHPAAFSLYAFIAEAEKKHIQRALLESGGVKKRAADLLKIPESTLRLKLKEYGIQPPAER